MSAVELEPGTDDWLRRITASKVAAILGVSPWASQRSIWHLMRGDVTPEPSNTAQRRGHYLEPAILAWWTDQHPEAYGLTRHPTYYLDDWAAATPDAAVLLKDREIGRALVEAKSSASDDAWGQPGTDEIPTDYLCQAYWQMHLSGAPRTYIPVLGPHLEFVEYVVDYDPAIGIDLEQRMRAFYDSLAGDEPPPLDDSVATFEVLKRLHPEIDRGEEVQLDAEETLAFVHAGPVLKEAEALDRRSRSVVLERMGRAQYATYAGVRIARRQPAKDGVALYRVAKPADLAEITDSTEEA